MEEEQGFEIDPEMAAQMGFASFGMQSTAKKRKYTHNDAVVDGAPPTLQERKTGANTTELGIRDRSAGRTVKQAKSEDHSETPIPLPESQASLFAHLDGKLMADLTSSDLDALAKGVRTPSGDKAYFKPNFISDPWVHLRKGNGQNR